MRAERWIIIMATTAMVLVALASIFTRYALRVPFFGAPSFVQKMQVLLMFLGSGVAIRRVGLVSVSYFRDKWSTPTQRVAAFVSTLGTVVFLLFILVSGVKLVSTNFTNISPTLKIPEAYPYMLIPLGAAYLLFCVGCVWITGTFRARPGGGGEPDSNRPLTAQEGH